MEEQIMLGNSSYGPTPFDFRLGGNRYFDFTLDFTGAPPSVFDYNVDLKDENYNTIKSFSAASVPVSPDGKGRIHIAWDGSADVGRSTAGGTVASYGFFTPFISAMAVGYAGLVNMSFCGGGSNLPPHSFGGGGSGGSSDPWNDKDDDVC